MNGLGVAGWILAGFFAVLFLLASWGLARINHNWDVREGVLKGIIDRRCHDLDLAREQLRAVRTELQAEKERRERAEWNLRKEHRDPTTPA